MKITGNVFVVTGAGNGMGREVTLQLLRAGGRVAGVDLSEAGLEETKHLAGDASVRLTTHRLIAADRAAVEALGLSPFDVRIGGWDTFQMVPYLRAEAPELQAVARALREDRRRPYVPHVTIGMYAVSAPLSGLAGRAAGWESPSITLPVTRLSLLRYDAADVAGPLTEVDAIDLTRPVRTPRGTPSG